MPIDCAFYNCSSLTDVNITDLAKWCGISFGNLYANPLYYAHQLYLNGTLITDLVIPDSVTSIGSSAFSGCSSLTSITIPDGVTSIGYEAFSNCSSLTSITIPDSVTSIGGDAFSGCRSLTSITIGNGVTSIGYYAFSGCRSLIGVYITDLVKWCGISFGSYDANPLHYAHQLYLNGTLITDLVIPEGVTRIGRYAFSGCSSLTSITIPDSVTSIGPSAFEGCSSLTSITIGNGVTRIDKDAFAGCSSLTGVYISDLAKWCGISFDYQANPLSYAHQLYLNETLITDLVIPDSVTSIGSDAFRGCNLTSVTIPDSVTSIGGSAFGFCGKLTSITFNGTIAQWKAISKEGYNYMTGSYTVHCTDGDIQK